MILDLPQGPATDPQSSENAAVRRVKSYWRDRPKTCFFVGLFAFVGIVGISVASVVEVTKDSNQKSNCNKIACELGTKIVTGASGVIGGISMVACKYKFGLSCGVSAGL